MHGYSLGVALDIACCADIRICSQDTKFSVKEVDLGLAADIGVLTRLPRMIGSQGWVKEICLTARGFGSQEALAQGFVSKVLSTKETALEEAMRCAVSLSRHSL